WDWTAPEKDDRLYNAVKDQAFEGIKNAYAISDKMQRQDQLAEIRQAAVAELVSEDGEWSEDDVKGVFGKLEKE
ncbi:MAG TPA: polyribonucleotide nucleotidyltransferase, partial [Methylophaga sp.]|nr:polyribonucleotide nucleotidyltransferase [Methylophaga sp.]